MFFLPITVIVVVAFAIIVTCLVVVIVVTVVVVLVVVLVAVDAFDVVVVVITVIAPQPYSHSVLLRAVCPSAQLQYMFEHENIFYSLDISMDGVCLPWMEEIVD